MSCFDDLKGYCGKDILGEWYHNILGEWHYYYKHEWIDFCYILEHVTSYKRSTIKGYISKTRNNYRHWSKEEYEKKYLVVTRYIKEKKEEVEKKEKERQKREEEERQKREEKEKKAYTI